MKAIWKNTVVAQSDHTLVVENNHYFPPESIREEYFIPSDKHTQCPWKGEASYYHLEVQGERNEDAAWYYPSPKDAAREIKNYIAFWKGVEVNNEEP